MSSIEWAAFSLKHLRGSAIWGSLGLELKTVEGVVALPDRSRFRIEAAPIGRPGYIEIAIIVIGDQPYLNLVGRWGELDASALAFNFNDLGRTLGDIILAMQDPVFSGTEIVAGSETLRMKGSVSSETLKTMVPNAASGFTVGLEVWVARDDPVLLKLRVEGKILADDQPDVVRELTLGDFDVPVEITPPPP